MSTETAIHSEAQFLSVRAVHRGTMEWADQVSKSTVGGDDPEERTPPAGWPSEGRVLGDSDLQVCVGTTVSVVLGAKPHRSTRLQRKLPGWQGRGSAYL